MNWQDYIVADNQVLPGKPTIKGTRISVELVLELPGQAQSFYEKMDLILKVFRKIMQALEIPK